MKKNNKTAIALSSAVLALLLMGTACSNEKNSNASLSPSPSVSAVPTVPSSPDSSEALATESASPSASPETVESTGEYSGLQDGHTIEIVTDQGPTAFQVSPEIADKVDPWESGTKVKFQYKTDENGEQLSIVSIDKQ
ncbi:hypothetical protein ACFPPD_10995 [Cohnella suwonensis]|uniref:Uncharacterized protein n=1 Tax=Cohnella suwonensis TaxID=696072 RepID=A0ABW0LW43_9BACL